MSDEKSWRLTCSADGVARLTLDCANRSANTLSRAVLEELAAHLEQLGRAPPLALLIDSGKASGFIAGADVREFTGFASAEQAYAQIRLGQRAMDCIADLPCPSIAVIHGFAMGGGLELALACSYRVGVQDSKLALALPEVKLGIHPGFGGTVRSVQLVGVRGAMDLMLTGKTLDGPRALQRGWIDRLCSRDQLDATIATLLSERPARRRPPLAERLLCWPLVRSFVARALRRQVQRHAREAHYPAPYALIRLWQTYGARGTRAYEAEARSIAALFESPSARGLVRVFLLQDRLKALGADAHAPFKRVHVVGAGVMGGDIAAWCALRGLEVTLQDRELKFIEPALKRAAGLFEKRVADADERARTAARLQADVEGEGLSSADVLIEAIFEDLVAKQRLFTDAERRLPAGALLATNTSSLTLESIAAPLAQPARLVGLHFFNPVAQMPLVEVIEGAQSDPQVLRRAAAFARRIDKLPLPCRSGPGFLVNRVLFPYLFEALYAAGEGVPLAQIDAVALDFGMPMGPIELADVVGLDVMQHVGAIISRDLGLSMPPHMSVLQALVVEKKLGRKSGQGFYSWADGKPHKPAFAGAAPADLCDRLILALVNECAACLRLQIVANEDYLDAGVVFGTGFAPFRGGPIAWARARGIDQVVQSLRELERAHGARFAPDAHWQQLATPV